MSEKKVSIIGAGLAGLATGCYLQMNGFDTTIYEQHTISGGLCTSWTRKKYVFDGCIHWILGSADGSAFYKLWNELIDMKNVQFVNHDIRVAIQVKNKNKYGDDIFYLYSSLERLEKYMMDISPADKKHIKKFINSIKFIQKYEVPPLIDKAPELRKLKDHLKLIKYIPFLIFMNKWRSITNYDFAKQFKSRFLREAFELFYEGPDLSMLLMTVQLAYYDKKSAGYPLGGSTKFISNIEKRYKDLGGQIVYGTEISKIKTEEDKAVGLITKTDEFIPSDLVISAADWHYTVFDALESKYMNITIEALEKQEIIKIFDSAILISFGISRHFKDVPHLLRFNMDKTLEISDGSKYDRLEAHVFNYDSTMAEDKNTVLSVTLMTGNADYWIDLRDKNYQRYKDEKDKIANMVLGIIEEEFGDIKNNLDAIDIATPASFYRYTKNRKGSIQGWMPSDKLFSPSPVKNTLPGLKNFYMVGHWLEPGGGLPPVLLNSRNTSQIICKAHGINFTVKSF